MDSDLSALLKILSEPGRVRILWLLAQAELAVHELQDILGWGQSRLSTQLGALRGRGLLRTRREGKWSFYALVAPDTKTSQGRLLREVLDEHGRSAGASDRPRLRRVLEIREMEGQRRFAQGGYAGEDGAPARTWDILARGLFLMLHPCRILDLGAGDGTVGCLAAAAGHDVTLLDMSQAQLDRATARAAREGLPPLRCVRADFASTGLPEGSFDRVILSHVLHHAGNPQALVDEAARLLAPGGLVWILELGPHGEEWMRVEQGDFWLGFEPEVLEGLLVRTGFKDIRRSVAGSDPTHPALHAVAWSARHVN